MSCISNKKKKELVLENRESAVRMTISLLKKWNVRLTREDVQSIADIALCETAERFDPKVGTLFTTYLYHYIRAEAGKKVSHEVQNAASRFSTIVGSNGDAGRPRDHMACLRLEAVFKSLAPIERQVLIRVVARDEKVKEVAEDLGYSRNHIWRIKMKALNQAREAFLEEGEYQH